jgi:hypothetical protein
MKREHHCHAMACKAECPPERLFCLKHWRMTPKAIQKEVWKYYTPGQCNDIRKIKWEWFWASEQAFVAVALAEGLVKPENAKKYLRMEKKRIEGHLEKELEYAR